MIGRIVSGPFQLDVPEDLAPRWFEHREIVKFGDPILLQRARAVPRFNASVTTLIARMTRIMLEARGLGLAAPQIGEGVRVLIYDVGDGIRALVNPKIVSSRGEQLEPHEGCLSIPGLTGIVPRSLEVTVKGMDARGRSVSYKARDMEARVIQHEVDHLDGVLFLARAQPDTLEWALPGEEDDDEPHDA